MRTVLFSLCLCLVGEAAKPAYEDIRKELEGKGAKFLTLSYTLALTGWKQEAKDYDLLKQLGEQKIAPDLEVLYMANSDVSNATLDNLASFQKLKELDLSDAAIDDEGTPKLKKLGALTTLWLARTKVTGKGLEPLKELKNLRKLDVRGTDVTPEECKTFQDDMKKLHKMPEIFCRAGKL